MPYVHIFIFEHILEGLHTVDNVVAKFKKKNGKYFME